MIRFFKPSLFAFLTIYALGCWATDSKDMTQIIKDSNMVQSPSLVVGYDLPQKKAHAFYVWASWCPYCAKETPQFLESASSLKDCDLGIVTISVDQKRDKGVTGAKDTHLDSFPMLMDSMDGTKKNLGGGIPKLIVTDANGIILKTYTGGNGVEKGMRRLKSAFMPDGSCTSSPDLNL